MTTAGNVRFVVLGLAAPRATWFQAVSRWANSGALPVEFVKCVGPDELRARLAGARPFSAALVDGGLPGVDRDLLAACADAGCPAFVVEDPHVPRDWLAVGAAAVLPATCDSAAVLTALAAHARPVRRADLTPAPSLSDDRAGRVWSPWRGTVVTVVGPGGTGVSTVAAALAQGLAADARAGGAVLLADLCRRAEQAMLHDAGRAAGGVQELTEAHRGGRPPAGDVRAVTFRVPARGYDLLCGLRQERFWPSLRPAAFTAAFASLTAAYRYVVADTDADFEGEADSGSFDVQERNLMARTALAEADALVVVGEPSMKGLHALTRVLHDAVAHGADAARVVPVLNRAARSPRTRAVMTATLAEITPWAPDLAPPVFLPDRPVDRCFRDGGALPSPLPAMLTSAVAARLHAVGGTRRSSREPERVRPGSLGAWHAEEAAG